MQWKLQKHPHEPASTTVIAAGSKHIGKFSGAGNYIVHGEVEGDCDISGHLTLEDNAIWKGTIQAENLVIAGEAEGDVIAKTKIKVTETARIKGNLTGAIIEVAEGATIQGSINIKNGEKEVLEFRSHPNKRLAE
jgi:cytoskeletal protein CcmA (bactofilin family)